MESQITAFSVYTLAMIGLVFIGLVVVKKSLTFTPQKNKNNFLKIEASLNLEPRKNLYVVKAGREKFLISSSGESCQFMSKLESNRPDVKSLSPPQKNGNLELIKEYFNHG